MKNILRLMIISAFVLMVVIACGLFQKDIYISKAQIQEMLDKKFPYDKNVIIARLTFDSPAVYFAEKNIGLKLNYYGKFLDKEIKGFLDFNGQIAYKQKNGAFYLSNFDIVEIVVDNGDFSNVEKLKTTILKIVEKYLAMFPVYKLDQNDFKKNLASLLIEDVNVKNEQLVITLGI